MMDWIPGMVIPNYLVDVKFRSGDEWYGVDPLDIWWDHTGTSDWDILAYKVSDGKPFS